MRMSDAKCIETLQALVDIYFPTGIFNEAIVYAIGVIQKTGEK
jgi:hypothetical protein